MIKKNLVTGRSSWLRQQYLKSTKDKLSHFKYVSSIRLECKLFGNIYFS